MKKHIIWLVLIALLLAALAAVALGAAVAIGLA